MIPVTPPPPDAASDPSDLLRALGTEPFVLLDDRLAGGRGARLFRDPIRILTCHTAESVRDTLGEIEAQVAAGNHAAGYLAYELNGTFEARLSAGDPTGEGPLLAFGLFDAPQLLSAAEADAMFASLAPPAPVASVTPRLEVAAYRRRFERLADYIRGGDVYQVNLSFPLDFTYAGDPLALYAALRTRQPVAHGAVVSLGGPMILSVSPELHLEIDKGVATTRPMKGTIGRGADPRTDAANRAALAACPKQRAENLMILDLMRNDLSRISRPGSVRVRDAFQVETYPTFHAMTSTVSGTLSPETGLAARLAALFPCGSITGAPKVRAMEIIRELEDSPRGVYTGSIGEIAPGGQMRLNVAIRTAVLGPGGIGRYSVGSGVVADSDAEAEYAECLLKGRLLADLCGDYGLVETLTRTADGTLPRLERHLDRLAASARALGFGFDRAAARDRLIRLAPADPDAAGPTRVRLELRREGHMAVTCAPLGALAAEPLRVMLHDHPVDRADPFLRHKTTRRGFWDAALATAQAEGADEALCRNREGLLTEATRFNLFVQRDGRLLTPPLSAGLLPGVLRAELLETGMAVEWPLTMDDLPGAEALYLGNSARGLLPFLILQS
jgi:para-aminobenzoate synthetase/4-amino-4-deoxychorismate lyase